MAKIYFISGFIGSGKTTYSNQLASEQSAFRFSIDEWMIPLYGEHMERDVFDARIETLTGLFKTSALRLLDLGVSVVFDFGFWKRTDREAIAQWARQHELDFEIIYLNVDFEVCCQRAGLRNSSLEGKSYEMTPEMLDLFWSWFEVPDTDENLTRVSF
jgi:predicted kinase